MSLKNDNFLEKDFIPKVKWRTIELHEVVEPELDEQNSAAPESVPKAATVPMAPILTTVIVPEIEVHIEPRGSGIKW